MHAIRGSGNEALPPPAQGLQDVLLGRRHLRCFFLACGRQRQAGGEQEEDV